MLKVLAVLRTLFLLFIIGYTVRVVPWWSSVPEHRADSAEFYAELYKACAPDRSLLLKAAWLAIAWIFVETILGWVMATRRRAVAKPVTPAIPPGEPPFAPPPRR